VVDVIVLLVFEQPFGRPGIEKEVPKPAGRRFAGPAARHHREPVRAIVLAKTAPTSCEDAHFLSASTRRNESASFIGCIRNRPI
jgi:hypothetical protein